MSVWTSPCYSIEPLRNAANNLPLSCMDEFPDELAGIANFTFGECDLRHPERANRNAADYYRDNPTAWREFATGGKRNLFGGEAVQFRNTLRQCNVKYAGIRCVYWAFNHFRNEEWAIEEKHKTESAQEIASAIFRLGAPAARQNQENWDKYKEFYEADSTSSGKWGRAEEIADAVRFLWTYKGRARKRIIGKKHTAIFRKVLGSQIIAPKTKADEPAIIPKESHLMMPLGGMKFSPEEAKAAYERVMRSVSKKERISQSDAARISTLTYFEYPNRGSRLTIFPFRGGLILYDKARHEGGFLLAKDHERLVQMLQGDAKLKKYYSKYAKDEPKVCEAMSDGYEKLMDIARKGMDPESDYKCNRVCRAFDVCQFLFLARLADDINDRAIKIQEAKIVKEKLDSIVDIRRTMEVIDNPKLGVKECLELAKFSKIFPCPDFCIYSVMDSVQKKSDESHKVYDSVKLGEVDGIDVMATEKEFELYCLRNRLINFYDVHKFLPGKLKTIEGEEAPGYLLAYPNVPVSRIAVNDMRFIDIEGTFIYRSYDGCESELVKDKVIAPSADITDTRKLEDFSNVERNQVLKYLFSTSFKDQETVNSLANSGDLFKLYKTWILIALKAEAKKPGSRPFMMATDEMRRLLSEAEANVATYVTNQRGSSQGKSEKDLSERMATLAATPMVDNGYLATLFAFDLEGFSPKQNVRFKQRAMKSWSHVFKKPEFDSCINVFTKTTLNFKKFDVDDSWEMVGNDLEGFHGRLNTAAHTDLMGYAVYKLKQLGLAKGTAGLEVLIDDGLLRIDLRLDPESNAVERTTDILDLVYQFAGQKISWDKTFVSRVLTQYLNRVFYDGVEVTPGAKAFMRIGKKQESAIPTIADEFMAHAASTRGAIQSGSDHILAYYEYVYECVKTMTRWGMKATTREEVDRLAFASYVPIGMGGLGLCSLFGIATNESFNSMQSGIANMKLICHRFPKYAKMANLYLNAGVRDMSTESILRNPTAWRTKLRCLNLRRFENAAKAKIIRTSTNALIETANRGVFDHVDDAIVKSIESTKNLSEIKRKLLWDMSIKSYIDTLVGKLQSSSTAASLIGKKKCLAIYIANKSEAKVLMKEMVTGKLTMRD